MTKIKKAKLFEENGKYFINVTYLHEDDRVIKEINIPKLEIPLLDCDNLVIHTDYHDSPFRSVRDIRTRSYVTRYLNVPSTYGLRLCGDDDNNDYVEKIIEEKVQEMTLDDIEKALGRKIKIVNKK